MWHVLLSAPSTSDPVWTNPLTALGASGVIICALSYVISRQFNINQALHADQLARERQIIADVIPVLGETASTMSRVPGQIREVLSEAGNAARGSEVDRLADKMASAAARLENAVASLSRPPPGT